MAVTVLIGAQWGDEGKGKVIDVLTERVDWVVRYQGGNNAGHTVEIGDEKYVLHLIPSGILRPGTRCVIGNGLVVDPAGLRQELEDLHARGHETRGRLFVSDRAHVVLDYHKALDGALEAEKTGRTIGTTRRGIGPAYAEKSSRTGLRMVDLLSPELPDRVADAVRRANTRLAALGAETLRVNETVGRAVEAAQYLRPYICDTIPLLNGARSKGDSILCEGAQGIMLDIDFGTYPYVTSSNTGASGVASGTGLPPQSIQRVVGVIKAYTTRVGEGPFPTELSDATGERLRERGGEYGATTGRPRRCGWFDGVIARYAATVCGVSDWAITKMDVLDDVETIRVCTAYECDGKRLETVPADLETFSRCRPVYEDLEGWQCSTAGCRSVEELPEKARAFVHYLEDFTGVKAGLLSLGPRRDQTLSVEDGDFD
ncbi:adenylosuccinate synthase [Kiritimatiella glycovorans]|uniref:Adenylosuccinate synthetase n=1 Tax=Kiritimatiella glycovorans TaxID=1307763 RepID=A0A0G3EGI9_9BACT|nr:adenylosuccinate synthase [Kiritimatiella glycovorans]AKJ65586.1 Adenylosuccinate synthetase [Kiritimatiella glycovorans]